ncbi:hypothetical protein ABBQ38_011771 [Trebouxia sp. C0009 RCD-2024]
MHMSHPLIDTRTGYRVSFDTNLARSRRIHRLQARAARDVSQQIASEVVVVGAGAAGLTAAYFAASQGAQVTVLEKNREAGKKVLISGGTRCNVLPTHTDLNKDYFTESKLGALRAVFASWSLGDCRHWLESPEHIGIPLTVEEADSKYFPISNSAKEVRDKLVRACLRKGVKFRYDANLKYIQHQEPAQLQCGLVNGGIVEAKAVVLATGGLSYPHLGTDGRGHQVLTKLGHSLHPMYPALTPLKGWHPGQQQLAGLSLYSVDAAAVDLSRTKGKGQGKGSKAARAGMLFTHRGFSGPAVLDLSHHAVMALERSKPKPVVRVSWTGQSMEYWRGVLQGSQGGAAGVGAVLHRHGLPKRLADALCHEAAVTATPLAQLKKGDRQKLLQLLTGYELAVTGHEGYAKAEVTGGGVPLSEVDCSSMQSKKVAHLFLCGEVCDVFGRIGGFNFYWAWLSGRLAGLSAAESCLSSTMCMHDDA